MGPCWPPSVCGWGHAAPPRGGAARPHGSWVGAAMGPVQGSSQGSKGVCCAVPRPHLASLFWVLLIIPKNYSSISCASKACPSRSRSGACPSRSREGACQQERWQIAKVQEEAKGRVGSAALTVHAVRCQKNCPKTLENDPGENHAMPKGRAVPHGNGLGICFAYTQHCSLC